MKEIGIKAPPPLTSFQQRFHKEKIQYNRSSTAMGQNTHRQKQNQFMSNSKPASPLKSKGNRPIYKNNLYYVADPSHENLTFDNESQNVYNTFQSQRNSLIQDNSQMFVQSMNLYQKDDFQRNRQKTNIRCVTPFIQTYVRDNGNNLKYNLPPTELKNDFKNINEVKKE